METSYINSSDRIQVYNRSELFLYSEQNGTKPPANTGIGNDIPEARNSMGNKKHEVQVAGELFYKSLTH
jgi:hypothetical protein